MFGAFLLAVTPVSSALCPACPGARSSRVRGAAAGGSSPRRAEALQAGGCTAPTSHPLSQRQGSGGCHPLHRHPQQARARCPHPSWLSQCEPMRLPTSSAAPCWASYGLVAIKIAGKRNRNPLLLSLLIMGTCKGYAGVAMHGETNSIQALGRAG